MFEYKDASFFTSYFQNHPDFKIIEEFKESDDENEKNLYVGLIEMKNTIHPLVLRVEIPFTFPHTKLTFRTKSLSGYPHLIYTGKIQHGSWFCLNTPFAETPVEQLNQEVLRLKEWITHQMNKNLPATIEDTNMRRALAMANAYEWENADEVKEFNSKAILTFVGDFEKDTNNFPKRLGHLHCIKTPDNRFYAFKDDLPFANYKLPYIIVDEAPSSIDMLQDFLKLKEYYAWESDVCSHLLKDIGTSDTWTSTAYSDLFDTNLTEEEAFPKINEIRQELNKDVSYIIGKSYNYNGDLFSPKSLKDFRNDDECKKTNVTPIHKKKILEHLDEIESTIRINHGMRPNDIRDAISECDEEAAMEWVEFGQYEFQHFALGEKYDNKIHWRIFFTNHSSIKSECVDYKLEIGRIILSHSISIPLRYLCTQSIDFSMFYGRGCLSSTLREKRIALIGLGAIGSMMAESLAHSGISKIGLWDSDVVEPGNICRSAFSLADIGESKVRAIAYKIKSINPFIDTKEIRSDGFWDTFDVNHKKYINGSFYDNINYKNQEESIKEIQDYDLIIDCTGSNEMLHFLSYAIPGKGLISLCITNHANELVCVTNADGNPFELRKAYLSRIEQDTKNFYVEGSGCYSPTFLAKYFDIAALVNSCVREVNNSINEGNLTHSCIFSHCKSGILIDHIHTYRLKGYDISLNIADETILDAKEMEMTDNSCIGYVLGCYSANSKQIMITHIVAAQSAMTSLKDAFKTSKGIIDYIGDYAYSDPKNDSFQLESLAILEAKSIDENINTNNPLLILKKKDGSISFLLYINNELVPFEESL